jgi:hypothetical protein
MTQTDEERKVNKKSMLKNITKNLVMILYNILEKNMVFQNLT